MEALQKIESTRKDESTAKPEVAKAGAAEYEVESESVGSKDKFKLLNVKGEVTRSCEPVKTGGCPAGKW